MNVKELFPSKWLSKEDVPHPTVVTIQSITKEMMNDNGRQVPKNVLVFSGALKPLILNKGNAMTIAAIHGDDVSAWIGKQVELWVDPTIQMQGRIVGGLRIRAVQQQSYSPQNGFSPAPSGNGIGIGARWDISDGTNVLTGQTSEQIQNFLADCKMPLGQVRIKPAGAPREQAKPADQWGFVTALQKPLHDPIPF